MHVFTLCGLYKPLYKRIKPLPPCEPHKGPIYLLQSFLNLVIEPGGPTLVCPVDRFKFAVLVLGWVTAWEYTVL